MNVSKVNEAKRLHALGFGVHWIRPNSKAPVNAGWTTGPREELPKLIKSYQKGYGLGTRLGAASKVGKYYLAALDVDVKGLEKRHKQQARAWVEENFPGLLDSTAVTLSGRGNGSMHVWVLVEEPYGPRKLTSSSEHVEVYMPSIVPSKKDIEILGKKKTDAGYRHRPAWEIDFMGEGRQVVLPPSVHPDSGKEYKWQRPINSPKDIKLLKLDFETLPSKKSDNGRPKGSSNKQTFEIEDVPLLTLELKLEDAVLDGIMDGEGVSDRSAFCLKVAMDMVRARFTDAQILGVLTNRKLFIGDVAYSHAKTSNRNRAARWAFDYCLRKARSEADFAEIFKDECKEYETLSPEESKEQYKAIHADLGQVDWKKKLDRTDADKLKPTLKNVILILTHFIGPEIFIRDSFALRDYYGISTPWGGKKGEALTDDDAVMIKVWFANKWKIEPTVNTVFEAMVSISSTNVFHPVRRYLDSLEWDGVPRVGTWLKDCLGAEGEEPYLSEVSKLFLIAAVARVFEPGIKFDHMLILEGDQGIGKSTVPAVLAGDKWFLDGLPDLTDKDAALNLQGIWICEMGELVNLRKSDVEITKSFITRRVDKVRPPYGKRYIESHRQCVFIGTTNAEEYLKDKTGNRRFLPVRVGQLDFDLLKEIRDQLWAEAVMLYELTDVKLYLTGEAKELAEDAQSDRVVEDEADVIYSQLSKWWLRLKKARKTKAGELGKKLPPLRFQTSELFNDFGGEDGGASPLKDFKQDNYKLQQASSALRKMGLIKITINGRKYWRENVKKLSKF